MLFSVKTWDPLVNLTNVTNFYVFEIKTKLFTTRTHLNKLFFAVFYTFSIFCTKCEQLYQAFPQLHN